MAVTTTPNATDTVTLDPEYRSRLTDIAHRQYTAAAEDNPDEAKDLRDELYDALWAVGEGAGRVVIPLPPHAVDGPHDGYVAKLAVPHDHNPYWGGLAQNKREAELWEETHSRHLVPVVASDPDDYWIVMPRGEEADHHDREFYQWRDEAEYALRDDVWEEDLNGRNTVRLDGEYRLCDYGVPPEHGD